MCAETRESSTTKSRTLSRVSSRSEGTEGDPPEAGDGRVKAKLKEVELERGLGAIATKQPEHGLGAGGDRGEPHDSLPARSKLLCRQRSRSSSSSGSSGSSQSLRPRPRPRK